MATKDKGAKKPAKKVKKKPKPVSLVGGGQGGTMTGMGTGGDR